MSIVYDNGTDTGTLYPAVPTRLMIKTTAASLQLIGFGWTKIGFEQATYIPVSQTIRATRLADFAQTPVVLIDIAQLNASAG